MSLYDKSSIALIPSGTKASKLYSVLPANGDGDFTHSRGSTATRVNKDGFIESVATNVPRLDYPLIDGVVQDCPALLLEPSRTNIQGYSESFSNWSKVNVTELSNQTTSPDGNQTADSVKENSGVNSKFIYLNESVTSGNDYTYSVFAKYNGTRYIQLTGSVGFGTGHANFDLQDGIITLESSVLDASITEYPNDWYRITLKLSCTTTTTSGRFLIALINSANAGRVATYAGDTSNGVYLWGAQFEISDYPTSYIQNLSTGTTTRSADACNGSGTSTDINSEEGVLFAEIAALSNADLIHRRITLSDGTSNNVVRIAYDTGSQRISLVLYDGSNQCVFQATSSNSAITDVLDFNKVALSYKQNEFKCFINGTQFGSTVTSGNTFSAGTLTELAFDNGGGGNVFLGKCKQLIVFNEAFTDAELTTLTT